MFEKHKDAKYPDAETRGAFIDKVADRIKALEGNKKEQENKRIAFSVLNDIHRAHDAYLFRQYYLRDEAVKALDEGDIDKAKEILAQIGAIE